MFFNTFYVCFIVLYVRFLFCVFCAFVLLCELFLHLYIAASLPFLCKFTDHCHRVENKTAVYKYYIIYNLIYHIKYLQSSGYFLKGY